MKVAIYVATFLLYNWNERKTMLVAIALLVSILIGLFIGLLLGIAIVDGYKSKRTCRECRRTIVEWGFSVDGNSYKAVKRD